MRLSHWPPSRISPDHSSGPRAGVLRIVKRPVVALGGFATDFRFPFPALPVGLTGSGKVADGKTRAEVGNSGRAQVLVLVYFVVVTIFEGPEASSLVVRAQKSGTSHRLMCSSSSYNLGNGRVRKVYAALTGDLVGESRRNGGVRRSRRPPRRATISCMKAGRRPKTQPSNR